MEKTEGCSRMGKPRNGVKNDFLRAAEEWVRENIWRC